MKKTCKQLFAILLSIIIICASISIGYAVPNDEINQLVVTVKTDKTSYGIMDSAKITVDVKNGGSKKVTNVAIAAFSDDHLFLTGNGDNKFEVSELAQNETVSFSFEIMLSPNSEKINFFQKILLFIKRIFVDTYESANVDSNNEGNINITTKDIVFSGISTILTIETIYYSETNIILADSIDTFSSALSDLINEEISDENFDSVSAMENEFYSKRIIVKSESLDYSDYEPETIIAGPDNTYIVQFDTQDEAIAFQTDQESKSAVEYAEPDVYLSVDPIDESDFSDVATDGSHYSWGVEYIEADKYAEYIIEKGCNSTVTVAVVDSGVDLDHSFLKNKISSYGYDYVEDDSNADDEYGHGTHVAGTIVDCMPGLNVKIMPVRVLDENGRGYSSAVASGIKYAASKGADVINLSLGGGHSSIKEDAVNYAISNGVVVCSAAGNENQNTSSHCPAHITTVGHITVAAIDSSGAKASFSNYGDAVDVAAPGVSIYSSVLNNKYGTKSGTSMATPHIAAVAAMFIQTNPTASPSKIENLVKSYTKDLGSSGYDKYYGYGVPKLSNAISKTTYTITYNANGGTGAPLSQVKNHNENLTLRSTIPTRSGYNFEGWSTDSSATSATYFAGSTYSLNKSVILYAVWDKIEINLSRYSGSGRQNVYDAYEVSQYNSGATSYDINPATIGWKVTLPNVVSSNVPGVKAPEWEIVSGDVVFDIGNNCMYIKKPGTVKIRYQAGGYYSDIYTYTLSLYYLDTEYSKGIRNGYVLPLTTIGNIPKNTEVVVSDVVCSDENWGDQPFYFADVTYNGITGWIPFYRIGKGIVH